MSMSIEENYKIIVENIRKSAAKVGRNADEVRIMAVTKTVEPFRVNEAVECGITLLGENRVQEFLQKQSDYSPKAEVHFIGGLQTNKVKQIIKSVSLIQSVDSVRLAGEISRAAVNNGIVMDILIQVNIGKEETKGGIAAEELDGFAESVSKLEGVKLKGLMTIPPLNNSEKHFAEMQRLFENLKTAYKDIDCLDCLSMGMSGDYVAAVEYGSTLVRLGTALFGNRY